jgi:hypothetical protein
MFDEARAEYPPPLKRLLGVVAGGVEPEGSEKIRVDPPSTPHRPTGVPTDWIYVPIAALNVQTFVLGLLRDATGPVPVQQIIAEARERLPEVSDGTIANIGTRLEAQGAISRSKGEGWILKDESRAPLLSGKYAWGASDMFAVHELAARRREMIVYLLGRFREGLQNLQILARLEDCELAENAAQQGSLETRHGGAS